MANAGRILIMPKGNYDANTEYEMLDLVFNGGASWVAKKNVVGIEPTDANTEHWMKMCESMDLTEVIQRIAALESQMLGTISLDDIDLSGYATKGEVATLSGEVNTLESDVDALEGTVGGLSEEIDTLRESMGSLSSKCGIASYTGSNATNDPNNPAKVTFDFVPKVVIMLGWKLGTTSGPQQKDIENGGYKYNQKVIFCSLLTTSYVSDAGFIYNDNISQPGRYAKKSADGKTIYWYSTSSDPIVGCNSNAYTYYVLGIG